MNEELFCKSLLATPYLLEDYLLSKGYVHKLEIPLGNPLKTFQVSAKAQCHRCKKPNRYFTVSIFNNDCLCESCDKKEKAHPEYQDVRVREFYATKIGLRNYCQPVPKELLQTTS